MFMDPNMDEFLHEITSILMNHLEKILLVDTGHHLDILEGVRYSIFTDSNNWSNVVFLSFNFYPNTTIKDR